MWTDQGRESGECGQAHAAWCRTGRRAASEPAPSHSICYHFYYFYYFYCFYCFTHHFHQFHHFYHFYHI